MRNAALYCLMGLAAGAAYGQAKLEFEVASIRPAEMPKPIMGPNGGMMIMRAVGDGGGPGTKDPSRASYKGVTMTNLLMIAYGVKRYQIFGPNWMDQERWDITAKVPEGATKDQTLIMLQNLLADRFKVVLHREKKEMPVYDLVTKGNVKLTESPEDPPPSADAPTPAPPPFGGPITFTTGADGVRMPVLPQGRGTSMMMMNGNARLNAKKETMDSFANRLSQQLAKPVTNSTGLNAKYDFTLTWSTEGLNGGMGGEMGRKVAAMGGGPAGGGGGAGIPDAHMPDGESAPNLFTAVQTLGLKLESKKAPVDLLVVDRLGKTPTEN